MTKALYTSYAHIFSGDNVKFFDKRKAKKLLEYGRAKLEKGEYRDALRALESAIKTYVPISDDRRVLSWLGKN